MGELERNFLKLLFKAVFKSLGVKTQHEIEALMVVVLVLGFVNAVRQDKKSNRLTLKQDNLSLKQEQSIEPQRDGL